MAVIKRVKALLRFWSRLDQIADSILINQGRILGRLARDGKPRRRLADYEFKVFSQWGEDGIIQRLVELVPVEQRTFVEFGVADFSESNCRFLMMNDNWRGLVIDGSGKNIERIISSYYYWMFDLKAVHAFVTADTIDALISESGLGEDLGILSVDIDGVDYWVLDSIKACRPRILIVEYNSVFGSERAITVPHDPAFQRTRAHPSNLYFGASLPAFVHWGEQNGYALVGATSTGANAFFVRKDLLGPDLPSSTIAEAFAESRFRESRGAGGKLAYLAGAARAELIRGLPVVDVKTGLTEPF